MPPHVVTIFESITSSSPASEAADQAQGNATFTYKPLVRHRRVLPLPVACFTHHTSGTCREPSRPPEEPWASVCLVACLSAPEMRGEYLTPPGVLVGRGCRTLEGYPAGSSRFREINTDGGISLLLARSVLNAWIGWPYRLIMLCIHEADADADRPAADSLRSVASGLLQMVLVIWLLANIFTTYLSAWYHLDMMG